MLDDRIKASLAQASKQHLLEIIDNQRSEIERLHNILRELLTVIQDQPVSNGAIDAAKSVLGLNTTKDTE